VFCLISLTAFSQKEIQEKIWAIQNFEYAEPDKAYKLADSLMALHNLNDTNKIQLYSIKGDVNWVWGDYDSSIIYYEKSLVLATKINRETSMCTAISNIGYIYMEKGNISKAIAFYLQSIELNKGKFIGNQRRNFAYIARAYSINKDTTNSFYYYKEALELAVKENDISGQAIYFNNMGTVYSDNGCYQKAEFLYRALADRLHLAPPTNGGRFHIHQLRDQSLHEYPHLQSGNAF
jgi:tetratricopeptide (TPR) repeat protein